LNNYINPANINYKEKDECMNKLTNIIKLKNKPNILSSASVVGTKEMDGPLARFFDISSDDERFGCQTYEQAESEMVRMAFETAIKKANFSISDIDLSLGGDLQNQCVAQSFGLSHEKSPYIGLYGACSNIAEALLLGGILLDSGHFKKITCSTSSHFAASERQFRFPLEYGCQRPQTTQNTVTGAATFVLSDKSESGIYINEALPGIITDMGIKDANNMGAAMACAALDTLERYFTASTQKPSDFDMIITGDLGYEGVEILKELSDSKRLGISDNLYDCGKLIYDSSAQDVHSGGSGCGCSAVVLSAYIMELFRQNKIQDILFVGTGALLSSTSILQRLSIPGIAHLVRITKSEL